MCAVVLYVCCNVICVLYCYMCAVVLCVCCTVICVL